MLLYFRSADLHYTEAAAFCAQLRRQNIVVCLPNPDEPPEKLAALPFTAAILHFDRTPDALPHPKALRQCFPKLPLIAIGHLPTESNGWRAIPETDFELDITEKTAELLALIEHLRTEQGRPPLRRCGIYLPEERRRVMLLVHWLMLTPAEHTLLRVLNASVKPLPAGTLSGFLAHPGDRHPVEPIAVHICNINTKAKSHAIPRPIGCRRGSGYLLRSPYDEILPEENPIVILK